MSDDAGFNPIRSIAPTVGEDASAGFAVGSIVIDTVADKAYICLDATTGAAVWRQLGFVIKPTPTPSTTSLLGYDMGSALPTWVETGSVSVKMITFADSPYTVQNDDGVLLFDCTGGAIVVHLPTALAFAGRRLVFALIIRAGNYVEVIQAGGDQIDGGAPSLALDVTHEVRHLVSDGITGWWSVGARLENHAPTHWAGAEDELSYLNLADTPSSLPPSGTAGGDLTGSYPNPTIGPLKVTTAKIAASAVTPAKVDATGSYTVAGLTNSGLTATRIPFSGTAGLQTDSGDLVFDGTGVILGGGTLAGQIGARTTRLVLRTLAGGVTLLDIESITSGSGAPVGMFRSRYDAGTNQRRRGKSGDLIGTLAYRASAAADDSTESTYPSTSSASVNAYLTEDQACLVVPTGLAAAAVGTAGSLAPGTYYAVVTARNAQGETTRSAEVSFVIPAGPSTGSDVLSWSAVPGVQATNGYRIYVGTSPGVEGQRFQSSTNSFTVTTISGTAATPPTTNTAYSARGTELRLSRTPQAGVASVDALRVRDDGRIGLLIGGLTTVEPKVGGTLFDHAATVNSIGTGETDLYSEAIVARTLTIDNDKLIRVDAGQCSATVVTRTWRVYFGNVGSLIKVFDSGAIAALNGKHWWLDFLVMRTASNKARSAVRLSIGGQTALVTVDDGTLLTGLDFTAAMTFKTTGQVSAGAVDGDIASILGYDDFKSAT